MSGRVLRRATGADVAAMLAIYAPYVTESAASFETEVPAEAEFARRLAALQGRFPCLVCEEGGRVAGYATAGPMGERAGYAFSAEASIYIEKSARGRGTGGALYRALAALLQRQGYCTLYALVAASNAESERFHQKMGFVREGCLLRAGYKFGGFVGLAYYSLILNARPGAGPPLPFGALPPEEVDAILAAAGGVGA